MEPELSLKQREHSEMYPSKNDKPEPIVFELKFEVASDSNVDLSMLTTAITQVLKQNFPGIIIK